MGSLTSGETDFRGAAGSVMMQAMPEPAEALRWPAPGRTQGLGQEEPLRSFSRLEGEREGRAHLEGGESEQGLGSGERSDCSLEGGHT